jgi:hypothetical protein
MPGRSRLRPLGRISLPRLTHHPPIDHLIDFNIALASSAVVASLSPNHLRKSRLIGLQHAWIPVVSNMESRNSEFAGAVTPQPSHTLKSDAADRQSRTDATQTQRLVVGRFSNQLSIELLWVFWSMWPSPLDR